jgi:23S rRNA (uracil1939-C5)-methyltransferase
MYSLERSELLDIESCPQMSVELECWFREFRSYLKPNLADKASFRLRIGPEKQRGVWMDLSNLAIKAILDEKNWLLGLLEKNIVVEMGQKRKRVVFKDGNLKLVAYEDGAVLETWTTSWVNKIEVPLFGAIGGFSQPGREVNRILSQVVTRFAAECEGSKWLELGCGNGNLSFVLQNPERDITSTDFDELSLLAAGRSLENILESAAFSGSKFGHIQFEHLNFQSTKNVIVKNKFDSVLVDPPRSGLGSFVEKLLEISPDNILYVSCFPESWKRDVVQFLENGYQIKKLAGVDLFPGTRHFEIVSLLKRNQQTDNNLPKPS